MSHCTSCGKPLTPGVAFCTACGATIAAPAPSPPGAPPAAVAPAPRSVEASAIIGESLRLTFSRFGAFLSTQGVVLLAGSLVGLAILLLYLRPATIASMDTMRAFSEDPAGADPFALALSLFPLLGWSAASGLVAGFFTLIAAGFGIVAADMMRAGERVSMGAVWERLRPRFGNYLATSLLVGLALLGIFVAGLLLFFLIVPVIIAIVVAIYFYLRWALAAPASIFESRRPSENLARSSELTRGVRGDLFVVVLVAVGLNIVPGVVVGALVGFASPIDEPFAAPPLWVDLARWAIGVAAQLVTSFFISAAFVGVYRKLTA